MSTGRKRKDAWRKEHPTNHCAIGRCTHKLREHHEDAPCRRFILLVRAGMSPLNCPYYNHDGGNTGC